MTELDEIAAELSLEQLEKELQFQLNNGESPGGTICSHIKYLISLRKASL